MFSRRNHDSAEICLPQADLRPAERQAALARTRGRYAYYAADDPDNLLAPVAGAGRFPLSEQYDPSWGLPYLPLLARAKAREWWLNLEGLISRRGKTATYATFFNPWFRPGPAADGYATDERLVEDRLQGPNPLEIRRVADPQDVARLLGALDRPLAPSTAVLASEALARGDLYQVDYSLLREAQWAGSARDSRWRRKYLPSPHALFWQAPADAPRRTLRPLAIRIDGADPESPVFRPDDGAGWELAKLYLRVADINAHIMGTHVYATHCVLEPFALSTPRHLSARHPIHLLLAPHLRFTLAVNRANMMLLRNPRQVYAIIYSGDLPITRRIIVAAARRTTFPALALPTDLARRGMTDAPVDYAYRDDALLHWAAIARFVGRYIDLFYTSDAAVQADDELARWVAELGAPDGGALAGLLATGAERSRDALAALLTQVLFTAGPGHAAVHFPQPDFHAAPAAYPAGAYAPPPRSRAEADAARFEATLPPLRPAAAQFRNAQLAGFQYDTFGRYDAYPLGRLAVAQAAIQGLASDLQAVEREICRRNRGRATPYPYLLPSRVPNSVNL